MKGPDKNTIYGIRMPYKGESIDEHIQNNFFVDIRKLPIYIIVGQLCKLLRQLLSLLDNGYIHGDIRCTNVLLNDDTGIFTIIDFDWFYPISDFVNKYKDYFGYYNNPPETLLANKSIIQKKQYIVDFAKFFLNSRSLQDLDSIITENKTIDATGVGEKTLHTFDSFGLAWTFLRLFYYAYPGSLDNNIGTVKTALAHQPHIDIYAAAVMEVVQRILLPLSDFRVATRRTVEDVYPIAIEILGKLRPVFLEGGRRTLKRSRRIRTTRKH